MMIDIRPEIAPLVPEIIDLRRDIHRHPELAFQERRTAALVAERLRACGLDVRTGLAGTGVTADLDGAAPGPRLALRADMDALPIQETNDVPYKSVVDGVMHACGHDGHVAALLGAARALVGLRDRLKGGVRFIFQPAEETEGGARPLIAAGVLDGVDEIYGLHLWNYQPCGTVGIKTGPVTAAASEFRIRITGRGGHGAAPQGTVDAVVVGSQVVTALQTIVSRNIDPLEGAVVTIGRFQAGGGFNVIADQAVLDGTTRAYSEENQRLLKARMEEILAGLGRAFGATIELDYVEGYPPTVNAEEPTAVVRAAARKIVGDGVIAPFLTLVGEDFSYYARQVPGCFVFVGSAPAGSAPLSVPQHCPHFDIDERALAVAASLLVQIASDRLA